MPQARELTDRYRLEKILRSGREATVLRAHDSQSAETVVVKLITSGGGSSLLQTETFVHYAGLLAAVRHPSVPRILDGGVTTEGNPFLVFELLTGIEFTALGGNPPERVLPLLAAVVDGLEAMAARGIGHYNLQPDNLFVAHAASGEQAKILGLGRTANGPLPPSGDLDARRYRAPELDRRGNADPRADLFSLAVITCQALGATIAMSDGEIAVQMPLALSFDLANDEALRQTLERCLRDDPRARPSHREVAQGFRLALGQSAAAALPTAVGDDTRPPLGSPARFAANAPVRPAAASPLAAVIPISGGTRAGDDPPSQERPTPPRVDASPAPVPVVPPAPPAYDEPRSMPLSTLQAPDLPHLEPVFAPPPDLPHPTWPAPTAKSLDVDPLSLEDFAVDGLTDHASGPSSLDQPAWGSSAPAAGLAPGGPWEEPHPALADWEPEPEPAATPLGAPAAPPADEAPLLAAQFLAALTATPATPPAPAAPAKTKPSAAVPPGWPPEPPPPLRPQGSAPPRGPATSTWADAQPSKSAGRPAPPTPPPAGPPADEGAGNLLSIDEDLLKALAAPPPEPPPAAAGARGAPASGKAAARGAASPAPANQAGLVSRVLTAVPRSMLFGGAALLVLLALAAIVLFGRHTEAPPEPPQPVVAPVPPPPPPPRAAARAKLDLAESYLAEGRGGDSKVRAALSSLTPDELTALTPAECGAMSTIDRALALQQRESLPTDLPEGLRAGDLPLLASLVAVASPTDVPPSQRSDFERAKVLAGLYEQAAAAAQRGQPLEVLRTFQSLQRIQHGLRDDRQLQAHAAAAIEQEVDTLGRAGRYAEALDRIQSLAAVWPDRTGLKALEQTYQRYAVDEDKEQRLLATLPTFERRRKPSEGLDLLRELTPTPHLAAQLETARKRLEDQLAVLDAQPPQVVLRDGYQLEYSRGMIADLSFRVTDDYEVKSVTLSARPEGGRWQELPLVKEAIGYTVHIPPTVHKNGTVEFYVVATDLSGHEGTLGSKEKPLQLKRLGSDRFVR